MDRDNTTDGPDAPQGESEHASVRHVDFSAGSQAPRAPRQRPPVRRRPVPESAGLARRPSTPSAESPPSGRRVASLTLSEALSTHFWCHAKFRRVELGKCLNDYVTHTAYELAASDCAGCQQGRQNRYEISQS